MTQQELENAINDLAARWNNVPLFWRSVLDSRWSQCFNAQGMLPWSNFFTGPITGYDYYEPNITDTYGIPPTMAWQLVQRITLNQSDGQYYLDVDHNLAVQMSFNGIAGFVASTGLPVLP
ncbi:MAG: hypothetical protein LBU13_04720 [Synergistaceae bacterium]|jgi:hypothetical protein|nr:hypothetical protein [Synergistaceae bacterium]